MRRMPLYSLALFCVVSVASSLGQTKKTVNTAADLPRFSYPLSQPASTLLNSDDATFNAFAQKVETDVNSVLSDYTIFDKETLRELLGARLSAQLLHGDMQGALATSQQIRDLQDKPAAKLTSGLTTVALVKAYQDSGASKGSAFDQAFQKHFAAEINALPWASTQETVKGIRTGFELMSPDLLQGSAKANLDPQVARTGSLDLPGAESLLGMRVEEKFYLPMAKSALAVLSPYIAAHDVKKPDIWAARDVSLTTADKLTPVRIAIFDSGVDTTLYPGLLFVDPHPDGHSPHGLAFDMQGKLYNGDLQPMTTEQKAVYPKVLTLFQGLDDLQNGIDSPAAAEARKTLSSMPPDQLAELLKKVRFLGQYMHGKHVAGIAVRGNPAARLVVVQFNDSLPDMPFAPTVAWAEKFKADFHQVGEYLRKNNVRVVNMSWADSQGEIEQWLNKTSAEKDPDKRKQLAAQIYAVWRDAVAVDHWHRAGDFPAVHRHQHRDLLRANYFSACRTSFRLGGDSGHGRSRRRECIADDRRPAPARSRRKAPSSPLRPGGDGHQSGSARRRISFLQPIEHRSVAGGDQPGRLCGVLCDWTGTGLLALDLGNLSVENPRSRDEHSHNDELGFQPDRRPHVSQLAAFLGT